MTILIKKCIMTITNVLYLYILLFFFLLLFFLLMLSLYFIFQDRDDRQSKSGGMHQRILHASENLIKKKNQRKKKSYEKNIKKRI